MVKCKVISYNPYRHVLVFDYQGILVQTSYQFEKMPEFIYALKEKNDFTISLENVSTKAKRTSKKVMSAEVELTSDEKQIV